MRLKSLLVGAFFRPPAKQILGVLPAGARLMLRHEPENPHDPGNAIMIVVSTAEIPQSQYPLLEVQLQGVGMFLSQALTEGDRLMAELGCSVPAFHIGYIPKAENKQLLAAGADYSGNVTWLRELAEAIGPSDMWNWTPIARLAFNAEGKPTITCDPREALAAHLAEAAAESGAAESE